MSDSDQMNLNLFTMNSVEHVSPGTWRHDGDRSDEYKEREYWTDVARTAERGGFDGIFFADARGIYDVYGGDRTTAVEKGIQIPSNDPAYLLPAMAEVTDDIGFAITKSTTYNHPYQVAREFSTLDHLTDGRVAFNVVTSFLESAAANLGLEERMDKETRYERSAEFLEVCYALWEDSWEDDAVLRDAETGVYSDPEKVHAIDHEGEFFDVPGPHGCEPSPQRTPVIYQAGSSDYGRDFAAANAEAVFCSQLTEEGVREYIEDVKGRAEDAGRAPDSISFFMGIAPIVAPTEEEAQAKYESLKESIDVESALALLSGFLDMDLSELDPDQKVEHIETQAIQGTMNAFTQSDPDKEWTVREVAEFSGIGTTSPIVVGTAEDVVDELVYWQEEVGVDGFNVKETVRTGSLDEFVDLVVPELEERGLFSREYEGETYREQLYGEGQARIPEHHPARQ